MQKINQPLCNVLSDDFSSFNEDTWQRNVSLGGFGNGEFEMTTASSNNLYIKNGQLYIFPTLTSDEIGTDAVLGNTKTTYNLTGCTETWNASDCSVTSDSSTNTDINPVQSARISTVNSVSLAYGKIEVVAKLPQGDWLWPAVWMLPKDNKYGAWPLSGEIDVRVLSLSSAFKVTNFLFYIRSWRHAGTRTRTPPRETTSCALPFVGAPSQT